MIKGSLHGCLDVTQTHGGGICNLHIATREVAQSYMGRFAHRDFDQQEDTVHVSVHS